MVLLETRRRLRRFALFFLNFLFGNRLDLSACMYWLLDCLLLLACLSIAQLAPASLPISLLGQAREAARNFSREYSHFTAFHGTLILMLKSRVGPPRNHPDPPAICPSQPIPRCCFALSFVIQKTHRNTPHMNQKS
jgi:hypothetical protein